MKENEIALCTSTYYPEWNPLFANRESPDLTQDQLRGNIALRMMESARMQGYQLVVVDGANQSPFRKEMNDRGIAFFSQEVPGMSAARIQAFMYAFKSEFIRAVVWLEPEKVDFVHHIPECIAPIEQGNAAVVVPSRTQRGWDSLPRFQRESEEKANRLYCDILRRASLLPFDGEYDFFKGPRVYSAMPEFRNQMISILSKQYKFCGKDDRIAYESIKPELYSNATFYPVVEALYRGLPVVDVPVDFSYPEAQRIQEERSQQHIDKRTRQQKGILAELVYYLRMLKGPNDNNQHSTLIGHDYWQTLRDTDVQLSK